MRRGDMRRRLRRLKWTGVIVTLATACIWIGSGFVHVRIQNNYGRRTRHPFALILGSGLIEFRTNPAELFPPTFNYFRNGRIYWPLPRIERIAYTYPSRRGEFIHRVCIPLWIPFLLVAIATVHMFWRDYRRIPSGHCQKCGYPLTGNTSGICPECGKRIVEGKM